MYIKSIECEETKMEDAVILMNNAEGSLHVLNETASIIWEEIDSKSIEEITKILLSKYENANEMDVVSDVEKIIGLFIEKGLINAD